MTKKLVVLQFVSILQCFSEVLHNIVFKGRYKGASEISRQDTLANKRRHEG